MAATSRAARSAIDLRSACCLIKGQTLSTEPPSVAYIYSTLALFFDPASSTAFIKIRLPVVSDGSEFLPLLLIAPEQILSLVDDRSHHKLPQEATQALFPNRGTGSIHCLHLTLSKVATAVGPLDWPSTTTAAPDLAFLAAQTSWTIYLPRAALSVTQVVALRSAISTAGSLKTSAPHADLSRLYEGRGGKIIAVPGQVGAEPVLDEEEEVPPGPPAYDSAVAGPSHTPPSASKKRRRSESGSSSLSSLSSSDATDDATAAALRAEGRQKRHAWMSDTMERVVERVVERKLDDMVLRLVEKRCGDLQAQLDAAMAECRRLAQETERLEAQQQEKEAAQRTELLGRVAEEIAAAKTRIMASVEERLDRMRDEVQDAIDEGDSRMVSLDEFEDTVDSRMMDVKVEMQDFVREELDNVEGNLREDLLEQFEQGTFYGSFVRPPEAR